MIKRAAITAVMASLMATITVQASQTVERFINVNQRINVTPESQYVIVPLTLPLPFIDGGGRWEISAFVGTFAKGTNGQEAYVAASISPDNPSIDYNDARTVIDSEEIANGRADQPLTLSRTVPQNGTAHTVYIMVWIHRDPWTPPFTKAQVYGWARAVFIHQQ